MILSKHLPVLNRLAFLPAASLSLALSSLSLSIAFMPTLLIRGAIAQPLQGKTSNTMYVSWYGPGFEGGYTANGEIFSRYHHTAAHPSWPFHTLVQLTHLDTGEVVTVRINDRSGGGLDISEQAARDLGTYREGITTVNVEILEWGL